MMPMGENGISAEGLDLLKKLLDLNPKRRITAKKALSHGWFKGKISNAGDMPKRDPIN